MSNTDTDLGEVIIERIYDAPRELIFECMTTPAHLTHFWGPPGVSTPIDKIVLDLRVGGAFDTTMINDENGEEYHSGGVFTEIDPPSRLVWAEKGAAEGMINASTFEDLGDGRTKVTIHQTNVPAMYRSPEALAGFEASLDRFVAYLKTIS